MIIVRNLQSAINRYTHKVKNGKLAKPDRCPLCKRTGRLSWHAEYSRKLITLRGVFNIPVKRLYCRNCHKTFSLLPDFVKKYHRYASDIIAFAVINLKKHHCDSVADQLMDKFSLYVSNQTLYAWKKKFPMQ